MFSYLLLLFYCLIYFKRKYHEEKTKMLNVHLRQCCKEIM